MARHLALDRLLDRDHALGRHTLTEHFLHHLIGDTDLGRQLRLAAREFDTSLQCGQDCGVIALGPLLPSLCFLSHDGPTVQLTIANGKQPMRGVGRRTLQSMVAQGKVSQRREFAERLHAVLDERADEGCPPRTGRGRPTWLWKRLSLRGRAFVSREQVRKYLMGSDVPDMANFLVFSDRLGVSPMRLLPGTGEQDESAELEQLARLWRTLDKEGRAQVLSVAALAARAAAGQAAPQLSSKTARATRGHIPAREPKTGS